MKKHFILGIMAVAALASCNKSEVLNQESLQEKGISFAAYAGKSVQTKTTSINTEAAGTAGIGVLAWRTGDVDVQEGTDAQTDPGLTTVGPKFMPNLKLTWDATAGTAGAWVYSPLRFWPSTGAKVSFFAYAPYTDGTADKNDPNNLYHPENITITNINDLDQGNQHILTLTVPSDDYSKHTDFMVARKGNGYNNTGVLNEGTEDEMEVGVNQNLNKDHEGAVKLQMKHALSKISFLAKAGDLAVDKQYDNGHVKVVFDKIKINGNFTEQASYNLFTGKWINFNPTPKTDYTYTNAAGTDNDPFTEMADELYNRKDGANADGWYNLTKTTHDIMVIPFSAPDTKSRITSITGTYKVVTYTPDVNDKDGDQDVTEYVENEAFTDEVDFETVVNLDLEEGKAYVFKFNIKLKEITFEVEVEDWKDGESMTIIDTDLSIKKSYLVTDEASFNDLLPEGYRAALPWDPNSTQATLPWLVVEFSKTKASELSIVVEGPEIVGSEKFSKVITYPGDTREVSLLTLNAEELGTSISDKPGDWKVSINGQTTTINVPGSNPVGGDDDESGDEITES